MAPSVDYGSAWGLMLAVDEEGSLVVQLMHIDYDSYHDNWLHHCCMLHRCKVV